MKDKMTPTQIAIEALKKIEQHEKDCSQRWSEATVELKHIKEKLDNHSVRWERVAWFLISGVGLSVLLLLVKPYI